MSSLFVERWWPYVLATAMTFVWWHYLNASFPANSGALIGATGTVSAVFVGFLITAKAIVFGLTGSAVFKALVSSGYHSVLFAYLFEAEVGALSLLVFSMVGFFVSDNSGAAPIWYQAVWMFCAFASLSLFCRVLVLLFSFLRKV